MPSGQSGTSYSCSGEALQPAQSGSPVPRLQQFIAFLGFQNLDELTYILSLPAIRDQQRIWRVDNNQILDADESHSLFSVYVVPKALIGKQFAAGCVSIPIFRRKLIHGFPAANIVPADI